ncbi:MAG: manganese efflux pump [Oscillospiraceae bacterium]|nr:manganese efflux pump [Oscillospiraceae bacterium]
MNEIPILILNSLLLGIGLAMDAFTVSLANGLNEPDMKPARSAKIAGVFAGFQAAMPMLGWFCVHTIVTYFHAFMRCIPWIALLLLSYIGGKMLIEGLRAKPHAEAEACEKKAAGASTLLLQGVATSIDALSIGFTIADLSLPRALLSAAIIAAVTFVICIGGLLIGRRAGMKLANKATVLGGLLLIGIGIEIFVSHLI